MDSLTGYKADVLNYIDSGVCHLLSFRGSLTHNTHDPSTQSFDDIDAIGWFSNPLAKYLGVYSGKDTKEIKINQYDIVLYETRKFLKLCSQGNPNVISMLFVKPEHHISYDKFGKELLTNRDMFKTQLVARALLGYAGDQFRRAKNSTIIAPAHRGYAGDKRKKSIAEFGYDTKYCGHLIRLLRMCKEYLETGELNVYRENDGEELYYIKKGRVPYEPIVLLADNLFQNCQHLIKAGALDQFPERPDMEFVNELSMSAILYYNGYGY